MFAYLVHSSAMPRGIENPSSLAEIGERLRLTRAAFGYTTTYIAGLIGSSTSGSVWTNYEKGTKRISLDAALRLCQTMGLTLDWIYRGNMEMLSSEALTKIQVQMRKEADQAKLSRSKRAKQ